MYLILQEHLVKLMSKMRLVFSQLSWRKWGKKRMSSGHQGPSSSLSISDLQASASALKETLIYLSCRAEAAQNQAESCLEVAGATQI